MYICSVVLARSSTFLLYFWSKWIYLALLMAILLTHPRYPNQSLRSLGTWHIFTLRISNWLVSWLLSWDAGSRVKCLPFILEPYINLPKQFNCCKISNPLPKNMQINVACSVKTDSANKLCNRSMTFSLKWDSHKPNDNCWWNCFAIALLDKMVS